VVGKVDVVRGEYCGGIITLAVLVLEGVIVLCKSVIVKIKKKKKNTNGCRS